MPGYCYLSTLLLMLVSVVLQFTLFICFFTLSVTMVKPKAKRVSVRAKAENAAERQPVLKIDDKLELEMMKSVAKTVG